MFLQKLRHTHLLLGTALAVSTTLLAPSVRTVQAFDLSPVPQRSSPSTGRIQATRQTSAPKAWVARHGLTGSQYQTEFDKLKGQGYRLTQVSGYTVQGKARYAALWEKRSGPAYIARHGLTSTQYQTEFNQQNNKGFRLTQVSGYSINGQARYAAIWEKGSGPAYVARHGLTSAQYQAEFNQQTQKGFRLTQVSGYSVNGQARYAAIWEKGSGPAYVARHGLTSAQYQQEFDKQTQKGFRLTKVSGYNVGGKDYYAAIWEKRSGPSWAARHGLSSQNYQCEFDNYRYQGYRPTWVSGYSQGGKARYAAIWESSGAWKASDLQHIDDTVTAFMKQNKVPGATLAVVKDGKLMLAKGYGKANSQKLACATSAFRIASVSKPVTSVAIMKLVEEGKLSLSDKVFGQGAILGETYGSKAYSKREKAITVGQLLEHTAGGNEWDNNRKPDGDTTGDPMFSKTGYNHKQLIGWVLDERKVDRKPGTEYNYSNFGYSILGRVIEKVTGQSYESYVRNSILKPLGAKGMRIETANSSAVDYENGHSGALVRRMDAHGGWVASPIDLMRFMVRVDGFSTKSDILKPSTLKTMTTSSLGQGYAKGWSVNASNNWWHGGKLGGNRSIMVRTQSGYSWALIVNDSNGEGSLDSTMWNVINGIQQWPSHDLF